MVFPRPTTSPATKNPQEEPMPDIRHRVEISAPVERVFAAASTPEGISSWWTRDGVSGSGAAGGTLEFRFGSPDPAAVVEVTQLEPDRRVAWQCTDGPSDWVGTEITFDLAENDDRTVVLFSHAGWSEPSEFMAHCSARWAYFLFSLKGLVERGEGTPHPEDMRF